MTNYNTFRRSLDSDPVKRNDVFEYHYNLGHFGTESKDRARLIFENIFINDPRRIEPLITSYFSTNSGSLSSSNVGESSKPRTQNQRNLEKSLYFLGSGFLAGGLSQLTDVDVTSNILQIYSAGATLAGGLGVGLYFAKDRLERK